MNAAILEYLKDKGEQLDADLARALRVPPAVVRRHIAQLSSTGDVISCEVTRFVGDKKIQGVSCRLAGYAPRPWTSHSKRAKRKPAKH